MEQNNTTQLLNCTTDLPPGDLWSEIEEYTLLNPIIIPSSNFEQNPPDFPFQIPVYPVPNISTFDGLYHASIPTFPFVPATGNSPIYFQYQQPQQQTRRPRLKPYQLDFLEKTFEDIKFPTPYEIECFRLVADLSEKQIKAWFQKRRIKWRKERIETNIQEHDWDNAATPIHSHSVPEAIAGKPDEDAEGAGRPTQECSGSSFHLKRCVINHMTPEYD